MSSGPMWKLLIDGLGMNCASALGPCAMDLRLPPLHGWNWVAAKSRRRAAGRPYSSYAVKSSRSGKESDMSGVRGGPWLGRQVRGLRPDRNPLRRGTDRLETCLLAGLLAAAA